MSEAGPRFFLSITLAVVAGAGLATGLASWFEIHSLRQDQRHTAEKLAALELALAESKATPTATSVAPSLVPAETQAIQKRLETLSESMQQMIAKTDVNPNQQLTAALHALEAQSKAQAEQISVLTAALKAATATPAAAAPPPPSPAYTGPATPSEKPKSTPAAITPGASPHAVTPPATPRPNPTASSAPSERLTPRELAYKQAWDTQTIVSFGGGVDQNGQPIGPILLDGASANSLGWASWRAWYESDEKLRREALIHNRQLQDEAANNRLQGLPDESGNSNASH